jgi:hypothetical protein
VGVTAGWRDRLPACLLGMTGKMSVATKSFSFSAITFENRYIPMRFQASDDLILVGQASCLTLKDGLHYLISLHLPRFKVGCRAMKSQSNYAPAGKRG